MRETWYVMDDGSFGDPAAVVTGEDGKLAHKDGRKVAYRPDGVTPRSRGVDVDAERAKAIKAGKSSPNEAREAAGKAPPTETRDLTAEQPKRGYKTRESKAD